MNNNSIYNPYDFINPVEHRPCLYGRSDEIDEINYYLSQNLIAERPINIAVIGRRSLGKTSLLNVIFKEADKFGFFPVKITIDETDTNLPVLMLMKIYTSIVSSLCSMNSEELPQEINHDLIIKLNGYFF
jgi:AAA+ ATPase superfamily predicted ATPase